MLKSPPPPPLPPQKKTSKFQSQRRNKCLSNPFLRGCPLPRPRSTTTVLHE